MQYLGNRTNAIRTGALTMTNPVPSGVFRAISQARRGTGRVSLSGAFTGAVDSVFDVEITSADAGSNAQVSVPQFTGIGNGTMTALTVAGTTDAQTFTVRLVDAGTPTAFAQVQIGPVLLRAKASGAAGNGIALTIDHSALVSTATAFSTRDELTAETIDVAGEQWDFGAVDLMSDGSIPPSAPRLRAGDDPQVYRQHKRFTGGRNVYSFTPATRRTIPADAPIYAITGTRTATLSQGATTENYTGLVTLYDLLSALRTSALVDVVGVVANDLLPPIGMGAVDLSFWTSAYVDGITRAGTSYAQRAQLSPVIASDAPTQTIRIECKTASTPGAETWEVRGAASGTLATLTTGVVYSDGPITSLTVPVQTAPQTQASGTIAARFTMQEGCGVLHRPVLGQNAVNRTMRWEYVQNRRDGCDCESIPVVGGPNPECLGVAIETGDNDLSTIADINSARKREIAGWRDYLRQSVMIGRYTYDASPSVLRVDKAAKRIVDSAITATTQALNDCISESGMRAKWVASTVYKKGDIRIPTELNGFQYECTVGGAAGASEPSWGTTLYGNTTDGAVTWVCIERDIITLWRNRFVELARFVRYHVAERGKVWSASASLFDINENSTRFTRPTTSNGHYYSNVGTVSTTSGTEPTWPTDGSSVADGANIIWQDEGAYWTATQPRRFGDILETYGLGSYMCASVSGTTGASEPAWGNDTVTDGTVEWVCIARGYIPPLWGLGIADAEDADPTLTGAEVNITPDAEGTSTFTRIGYNNTVTYSGQILGFYAGVYDKWGIASNFDEAGSEGNGCWQEPTTAYVWRCVQGGAYLDAEPNRYYHSVVRINDALGNPSIVETREFGFQISSCDTREGDTVDIDVIVEGSTGAITYQEGDAFTLSCVNASAIQTAGGTDGTNTLTWRVTGSVDGALDDLLLDLTNAATWVYSDGGVAFTLTPGAIAFRPGDSFAFTVQGGQFRWRQDGGAWTEDVQIQPTVSLASGVSVVFTQGVGESFPSGDSYTITAVAINGVDQLRAPTDGRAAWTEDGTEIELTTVDPYTPTVLALFDHTIPEGATITLTSNGGVSESVPWNERHIALPIPASSPGTVWTLTIDTAGSVHWMYLDVPHEMKIESGITELGLIDARYVMPTAAGGREGDGFEVTHTMCTKASVDDLRALLAHATRFDDSRIGVLPNALEPEGVELVEFGARALNVTDALGFQPRNTARRFLNVTLDLEPAA